MQTPRPPCVGLIAALCLPLYSLTLSGCRSAYYKTMETFGVQKRHILVDRVEEGRDAQEEASEQFQTALESFKGVVDFEGGDLEKAYNKFNGEFEDSEESVNEVKERIASIEEVSSDLFREWQEELSTIQTESLRSQSEAMMKDTRAQYDKLIAAMKRSEAKMDPVLQTFRDNVLFIKHNLNAKAISSLSGQLTEIEGDVEGLLVDMRASIDEANAFIENMQKAPAEG
jgi:hypothetical protein